MLNFQKFNGATNSAAKKAYQAGEKDQVILRVGLPTDISKTKLLLLTIFLGFIGAHYYYVGRKRMGLFFTSFFFVGILNAIISIFFKNIVYTEAYQVFYMFVLTWGFVILLWMVDIFKVLLNRFKVPVSVEIQ